MPEKSQPFRGISLKRELVEEIERFILEYPQYKSIADFVHESARIRMEEIRQIQRVALPRFEQINFDTDGVKILDRQQKRVADIQFRPQGIWCNIDEKDRCEHIDFALSLSKVKDIVRKHRSEGWRLPEL